MFFKGLAKDMSAIDAAGTVDDKKKMLGLGWLTYSFQRPKPRIRYWSRRQTGITICVEWRISV
jgi:hypothetical protein